MSYRTDFTRAMKTKERRAMGEAIGSLRQENPEKYAELLRRAKDEAYDARLRIEARAAELQERKEQRRLVELKGMQAVNKPVISGLPDIDMQGVRGMIAFRVWEFDALGLRSTAMLYHWKEVNFADRMPERSNTSGLYSIKLSGLSVLTAGVHYFNTGQRSVSGFVELLGKIVEHTDGVMRAEVAKLTCLFVTSDNDDLIDVVRMLYERYPVTPVFVLNPEQLADVVMREVLRQRYLR